MGEGWYEHEGDHCWMGDEARVELAGPSKEGQRIRLRGFSPHHGARLSVSVEGTPLGSCEMPAPGLVETEFPLPSSFVGRTALTVRLTIDKVYNVPGDPRTLGFSMNVIEIV